MLSSAFVLLTLAHQAAFDTSCALALTPPVSLHHVDKPSSSLSYSNGGEHGNEPMFSPLPRPLRRRRGRGIDLQHDNIEKEGVTRPPQRHIPRRAMPHVENDSTADAATRAGYIIRNQELTQIGDVRVQQKRLQTVRPLRRVVHRNSSGTSIPSLQIEEGQDGNQIGIQSPSNNSGIDVQVGSQRPARSNRGSPRLSLSRNPTLDEFLDKPEQLPLNEDDRKGGGRGARRVTFKATRSASKSMLSKSMATLTEYMTQPVSQYSLLSFHDAEGSTVKSTNKSTKQQPMSRRWLVRRLTAQESQRYFDSAYREGKGCDNMDESNLFRLAVPLLPLIGWDLTPVIDLEVIPPKNVSERAVQVGNGDDIDISQRYQMFAAETVDEYSFEKSGDNVDQSKWAPLKCIRQRMRSQGDGRSKDQDGENVDSPPVVKIRSLRVSLLSTQEEVKEVMSNNNNNNKVRQNSQSDRTMQKEALDMVSKVEEWLKPHITFEAELSWQDGVNDGMDEKESTSTVTVKSTAITSLTIPKIPSDILRATVPSGFLVKRLGATLTSQALAICLPRFLRQLEKDYNRWSGLADKVDNGSG